MRVSLGSVKELTQSSPPPPANVFGLALKNTYNTRRLPVVLKRKLMYFHTIAKRLNIRQ
jgi:hypothetical protein